MGILAGGGVLSLILNKQDRRAVLAGQISCLAALLILLVSALYRISRADSPEGWSSAWFQLPIALTGIAAALHAPGYLAGHAEGRHGIYWFFFNMMLGSMTAAASVRGFLSFLTAWELMGLTSFALVAFDWRSRQTQRAAWIYLLACEGGGLLLFFYCAIQEAVISSGGSHAAGIPNTLMVLQMAVGMAAFGLKAGFPFLHIWLPEAHPAAPSPVSAVMSGAMIPLGFYGILRFAAGFQGDGAAITGWSFLILGITGAFPGILFGLVQKDLKKLLAYSSMENMGIISLGFGFGFLGTAYSMKDMMLFGFTGAFLHILNHALLKGALFLGAGSVFKSTHTLNLDLMGGLMKKMPWTGGIFTIASLGICGLPPFCGFTGELMIYLAAFSGISHTGGILLAGSFTAAVILALTGGIACMAFAKAVSSAFLGEPRTEEARHAHSEERSMAAGMIVLILPALLIPFAAPWIVWHGIAPFFGGGISFERLSDPCWILAYCAAASAVFGILFLLLTVWRRTLRRGKEAEIKGTWDCGYAHPTPRMEYTGTAFSQPAADLFNGILHQHKSIQSPEGLFPEKAGIDIESDDFGDRLFWRPVFQLIGRAAEKVHKFQSGSLHLYIMVMVIALLLMLVWGFGFDRIPADKAGESQTSTEACK